ncbi:hypothetical protein [Hoeflea marina]|uniref:hypothetical protein n=1 Tax=Hoeflea marina TaxID=274592 RepID=UPI000D70B4AC|nr:hypothetical protein [Hoeflea marina]
MLKFLASISLLALTCAPAMAGDASEVVKAFYADPGSEYQLENRDRFVDPVLKFLVDSDAAWNRDETVCIDFVFSIDGQDFDLEEITRTLKLDETVNGDTARVMAHFTNFDNPTEVEWTLVHSSAGWQVSDIASLTNEWRVSDMTCQ